MDKHRLQAPIAMGAILGEHGPRLEPVLGPGVVGELKVLLTDQHGPNLRNKIAHGEMRDAELAGPIATYAWWLVLHMVAAPVVALLRDGSASAPG
jgi:hypothetical protein